MEMIFITAIGMVIGAAFACNVAKILKIYAGLLPMAIMIAWDGIWIYMVSGYAIKKELAIGIILGTIIKTLFLLNYAQKIIQTRDSK